VSIELNDYRLVFSHNGKSFIYDTSTSLIKQVSSAGKEDPNAEGQFGPGFMTTHEFSRRIRIDGCMKVAEKKCAPINGFVLDFTSNDIQTLITKMKEQIKYADDLLDGTLLSQPIPATIIPYYLDDVHFPVAEQEVDNAMRLLSYVVVINSRIERV